MLNDGGRWWFQEVHGLGRMLATIRLLVFDALGVHFACVVELGDVKLVLQSAQWLLKVAHWLWPWRAQWAVFKMDFLGHMEGPMAS